MDHQYSLSCAGCWPPHCTCHRRPQMVEGIATVRCPDCGRWLATAEARRAQERRLVSGPDTGSPGGFGDPLGE
jgi:hypothetical protein